jgi:hypothetical protein
MNKYFRLVLCTVGIILSARSYAQVIIKIYPTHGLATSYLGNGVQWDPYETKELSDADWQKDHQTA